MLDALSAHAAGVVGTEDALFLLRTGAVPLAIVYATDIANLPGVSAAAALPDQPVAYTLAITSIALSAQTDRFFAFLQTPPAQDILRHDGLEIAP